MIAIIFMLWYELLLFYA